MKALEKGYRIAQMHEVWHFPQKSDTLFKECIDTFAKIKLEASGYPKNCVTDVRTKAMVRQRYFREPRHPIRSYQNNLQSRITYPGQIDAEFVLG